MNNTLSYGNINVTGGWPSNLMRYVGIPYLLNFRGVSKSSKAFIDKFELWNAIARQIGLPTTDNDKKPYEVVKKFYKYYCKKPSQAMKGTSSLTHSSLNSIAQLRSHFLMINGIYTGKLYAELAKQESILFSTSELNIDYIPSTSIAEFINLESLTVLFSHTHLTERNQNVLSNNNSSKTKQIVQPSPILPDEIGTLIKLKILTVQNADLTFLPAELSQLTQLTSLNFSENKLKNIRCIHQFTSLTYINLANNNFKNLPQGFSNLINLTYCNLSDNHLTCLNEEFQSVTSLQTLVLSSNFLPNNLSLVNLSNLNSLSILTLSKNRILKINDLKNLMGLTQLDLRNNHLSKVPDGLMDLSNLVTLAWDHRRIDDKDKISRLANLTMVFEDTLKVCNSLESWKQKKKFIESTCDALDKNENVHKVASDLIQKLGSDSLKDKPTEKKRKVDHIIEIDLDDVSKDIAMDVEGNSDISINNCNIGMAEQVNKVGSQRLNSPLQTFPSPTQSAFSPQEEKTTEEYYRKALKDKIFGMFEGKIKLKASDVKQKFDRHIENNTVTELLISLAENGLLEVEKDDNKNLYFLPDFSQSPISAEMKSRILNMFKAGKSYSVKSVYLALGFKVKPTIIRNVLEEAVNKKELQKITKFSISIYSSNSSSLKKEKVARKVEFNNNNNNNNSPLNFQPNQAGVRPISYNTAHLYNPMDSIPSDEQSSLLFTSFGNSIHQTSPSPNQSTFSSQNEKIAEGAPPKPLKDRIFSLFKPGKRLNLEDIENAFNNEICYRSLSESLMRMVKNGRLKVIKDGGRNVFSLPDSFQSSTQLNATQENFVSSNPNASFQVQSTLPPAFNYNLESYSLTNNNSDFQTSPNRSQDIFSAQEIEERAKGSSSEKLRAQIISLFQVGVKLNFSEIKTELGGEKSNHLIYDALKNLVINRRLIREKPGSYNIYSLPSSKSSTLLDPNPNEGNSEIQNSNEGFQLQLDLNINPKAIKLVTELQYQILSTFKSGEAQTVTAITKTLVGKKFKKEAIFSAIRQTMFIGILAGNKNNGKWEYRLSKIGESFQFQSNQSRNLKATAQQPLLENQNTNHESLLQPHLNLNYRHDQASNLIYDNNNNSLSIQADANSIFDNPFQDNTFQNQLFDDNTQTPFTFNVARDENWISDDQMPSFENDPQNEFENGDPTQSFWNQEF